MVRPGGGQLPPFPSAHMLPIYYGQLPLPLPPRLPPAPLLPMGLHGLTSVESKKKNAYSTCEESKCVLSTVKGFKGGYISSLHLSGCMYVEAATCT